MLQVHSSKQDKGPDGGTQHYCLSNLRGEFPFSDRSHSLLEQNKVQCWDKVLYI